MTLKKNDKLINEQEIKLSIKDKYSDVDNKDANEMYQILKDNKSVPKNKQELETLFKKLDKIIDDLTIDDSEY